MSEELNQLRILLAFTFIFGVFAIIFALSRPSEKTPSEKTVESETPKPPSDHQ
ncbi:MAG: hypothetical protein Q8P82_02445 [bacterium]|nr:hypothetical protein [bacterium]